MKKKLIDAVIKQIQAEMYSANLYLSMMCYFSSVNLDGFADYMKAQYDEEMFHAMKFVDYLNDRGAKVVIQDIPKPSSDFKSALDVFEKALKHEEHVSDLINKLYSLAEKEGDNHLKILLHWFIQEQTEEEQAASKMVENVKMVGESGPGIYILNKEAMSLRGPSDAAA